MAWCLANPRIGERKAARLLAHTHDLGTLIPEGLTRPAYGH